MLRCARSAHKGFARGARAAPRTTPLLVARVARLGDARLAATAAGRRALFSALTQSQIDFSSFSEIVCARSETECSSRVSVEESGQR